MAPSPIPAPSPVCLIQALDGAALNRSCVTQFAALSATVAGRHDYFPPGVPVDVLYPPPHRSDYRCGKADYFFTSSRLDGPKRIGAADRGDAHSSRRMFRS